MDDKKKGIEIDEMFEEEITSKKSPQKEGKKTEKTEIDEIFEEFLPAPAEPLKKKKKASDELLEEYVTPKPKIVEKKKPEKVKEEKVEEGLTDFLIHPPVEEEKKRVQPPPPKKEPTPVKEPPSVETKKVTPPPKPVEPPPQPIIKEKEIVIQKPSSLLPFISGFFTGGFFVFLILGALWVTGPLKNFSKPSAQLPSGKVVIPPPPEEKGKTQEVVKEEVVQKEPPPQKVVSIPEEKPREIPQSPPPVEKPPAKFILTISNIRSDRDLRTVKEILRRNGVDMNPEEKKETSKDFYELYLDATYTPEEAEAVKLKLDIIGIKCTQKETQFSCGRYGSLAKANEIRTMLSNAGLPAKLRIGKVSEVSYTVTTLSIESDKESAIRGALKKFRITSQKIE